MVKQKAFLLAEGMTALIISLLSLSLFMLVVSEGRKVEIKMEEKTDRAYARHLIQKEKMSQIMIHDHVYSKADME